MHIPKQIEQQIATFERVKHESEAAHEKQAKTPLC